MNTKMKSILPLMLLAVSTLISSCASADISDNTNLSSTANSENSQTEKKPSSNQSSATTKSASNNSPTTSGKTTQVTLYTSDDQCQGFIPKQTSVSADEPMKAAIGKILETQDTGDFSLAGYRATVNNGVATVDLRVAPESKRQIASLSNCEQFAIFGSLRETLTKNTAWKIRDVRFTQGGQEILF